MERTRRDAFTALLDSGIVAGGTPPLRRDAVSVETGAESLGTGEAVTATVVAVSALVGTEAPGSPPAGPLSDRQGLRE